MSYGSYGTKRVAVAEALCYIKGHLKNSKPKPVKTEEQRKLIAKRAAEKRALIRKENAEQAEIIKRHRIQDSNQSTR